MKQLERNEREKKTNPYNLEEIISGLKQIYIYVYTHIYIYIYIYILFFLAGSFALLSVLHG